MNPIDLFDPPNKPPSIFEMGQLCEYMHSLREIADKRGMDIYWRGQADYQWGLQSALVRRIAQVATPTSEHLKGLENKLLKEVEGWAMELKEKGKGYRGNNVAKLAFLQHHGVPTRLLDFTRNPSIALFFAVDSLPEVDGRIFAVFTPKSSTHHTKGRKIQLGKLTSTDLLMWKPKGTAEFPRIEHQEGLFAIAGLTSSNNQIGYDRVINQDRKMLAEEVRSILSLPLKFTRDIDELNAFMDERDSEGHAAKPCAISARIHLNKASVIKQLRGGSSKRLKALGLPAGGLSHKKVYPDVDGFTKHSPTLNQLDRGVILP
jgi:hypothetical protein